MVFCVDAQDRIHPYSLHGDFCENGIYQQVMDLKGDISIKYVSSPDFQKKKQNKTKKKRCMVRPSGFYAVVSSPIRMYRKSYCSTVKVGGISGVCVRKMLKFLLC